MLHIKVIKNGKNWAVGLTAAAALIIFMTVFIVGGIQKSLIRSAAEAGSRAGRDYSSSIPIYSVDNDKKQISITFNCAWEAEDIPSILDTLDRYHVKATFFVLGVWAEKNPEALKMIAERGHEIGNHSYSHKLPSRITQEQIKEEIDRCNAAVKNIIGAEPSLYRAPSGDYNDMLISLVRASEMVPVQWSVDSIDWDNRMSGADIVSRVTGKIHPGAIILFHSGTAYTAEVLPEILSHLQAEKYEFVPVSKLIYPSGHSMIDHTGKQFDTEADS